MSNRILLAAGSVLVLVSVAVAHDEKPASGPATTQATTREFTEVRLAVGREDEYDGMIEDLALPPEQAQAVRKANSKRIVALKAFVDGPVGKQLIELREQLAASRREGQRALTTQLREKITPLDAQYWVIRTAGRQEVLRILSPEQLRTYVAINLADRIEQGLRVQLSAGQKAAIRKMTDEAAAKFVTDKTIDEDPFFRQLVVVERPLLERASRDVLTAEQKARIAAAATRASTRAATRAAATRPQ